MAMSVWRLFLLGGFRLERTGETITKLRTQKTVTLLAWLALHPHREHGREELIERFWPESELEQGRASLRVALNALRKVLEPPPTPSDTVLITTRTHIKIRPEALTTDVATFEAALKRKDHAEAHGHQPAPRPQRHRQRLIGDMAHQVVEDRDKGHEWRSAQRH